MNGAAPPDVDALVLRVDQLRWRCDEAQFDFVNSNELPELCDFLGQGRALEALTFGMDLDRVGYNVFALGPPGIGKRTVVRRYLEQRAAGRPTPSDWCYVNNFENLRKPLALAVPAGRGVRLRGDVKTLIRDLSMSIPAALESEEHKNRIQGMMREAAERQEKALNDFAEKSLAKKIQLIRTPNGFMFAPLKEGEIIAPEAFQQLPEEERLRIEQAMSTLQAELGTLLEAFPKWDKETHDRIRELNRGVTSLAIGHLLTRIKEQYSDLPRIATYFDEVERDILERVNECQLPDEGSSGDVTAALAESLEDYEINLLVDNSATHGAPVVFENHPSYQNLIGSVEHETEMGTLITDYNLIKAGALHRANGGYLLLDGRALLQQPFAWEALERALRAKSIKIESLGESLSLVSTVSLEPEPIPLNVKVVVTGDRPFYYLLYSLDPDFADLFKVAADFDEHVDRTPENCRRFACFLGSLARSEKTRPLDRSGAARLIEHAARVADDSQRLSVHARTLADVLREADYWAGHEEAAEIHSRHVEQAIERQIRRSDRVRQRIQEEIERGTILIDTVGSCTGQVNGLSVIDMGDFRFGMPSRISATARLGRGEVVDIEREVELGGAIHSKGVLILASFLGARYAQDRPLSLSASVVFEQSYDKVEGDSASLAELCALLSVLGAAPIRQSLAVTGSVNQLGQVQPVGGVNEKIEGFFDVCRRRGLTADQGVVIPRTNIPHLMLREDVVAAVAAGKFHVYAVETVDEAMALLTGLPVGGRLAGGQFPRDTVNYRVEAKLRELADVRRTFTNESPSRNTDGRP